MVCDLFSFAACSLSVPGGNLPLQSLPFFIQLPYPLNHIPQQDAVRPENAVKQYADFLLQLSKPDFCGKPLRFHFLIRFAT